MKKCANNKRIFSAGPSITNKEIAYVNDAIRHGWYAHYRDYTERFETAFSEYVGAKYAIATNCCTSAMHLAVVTLGLKQDDEVIVPDLTWIATASVLCYEGVRPVFVDIEKDSWTLEPRAIKKAITKKTKAIFPVHLYGHPADMQGILDIAKEYDLHVFTDAAPAIGSEYRGKKVGGLAEIECFSFQGAKIMVTGEGGMFVTNSDKHYERASMLVEDGRVAGTFYIKEIGFHYRMANLLASLGLAQLERAEELIKAKRKQFDMYYKRLGNVPGIRMFKEKKGFKSNCSYPSIFLERTLSISRDGLIAELKKRNIYTRPVFPKLSDFNMFERADNPIAANVASCGMNLPTAFNLTEKDIDYVSDTIKEILKVS